MTEKKNEAAQQPRRYSAERLAGFRYGFYRGYEQG